MPRKRVLIEATNRPPTGVADGIQAKEIGRLSAQPASATRRLPSRPRHCNLVTELNNRDSLSVEIKRWFVKHVLFQAGQG